MADGKRTATLQMNDKAHPTVVRVQLPTKITQAELNHLVNQSIVQEIVFKHTGCTCLSGTINVLFESVYQEAVQVDLSTAR
jgi:hypothetical protein